MASSNSSMVRKIFNRANLMILSFVFGPRLNVEKHDLNLVRLGTAYDGWTFVDLPNLRNARIISCGLGEEGSFDLAFAAKYNARVLMVDPTPRAIKYFNDTIITQGVDGAFELCAKALWKARETLRFYAPPDASHVSHSIINFQNAYKNDTAFIEVEAITISDLMEQYGIETIPLLKLDIEGAEIEVVQDMLAKRVFPDQLLIEYDELTFPSPRAKSRIEGCHNALAAAGYRLVNWDKPNNLLYVKSDLGGSPSSAGATR